MFFSVKLTNDGDISATFEKTVVNKFTNLIEALTAIEFIVF